MQDDIAAISRFVDKRHGMHGTVVDAARRLLAGIEDDADRKVLTHFTTGHRDAYPVTCEAILRVLDARSKP